MEAYREVLALPTRLRLRRGSTGILRLRGVKHPLVFRPTSVAIYTVEEVFFDRDYDVEWPASWGAPRYIVDGGANIGCTSVFFANQYPDACIVSIELEESNYSYLLRNAQPYRNIRSLRSAIWAHRGFVAVRDQGFGLRGFVVEEVGHDALGALPAVALSDLIAEDNVVDVLKLDIEGSEKVLFEGDCDRWLPFVRCVIIELHDRMVPGCTRAVFRAIGRHHFSCSRKGDKLVCLNERAPERNE
jgi:FkbM family methyltransferase